jgi:prepilin signal peptidase PulO-like enzyme (type II secretory pathway)
MGWFLGLMGGASAIMFGVWIGAIVAIGIMGVQRLRVFHSQTKNAEQNLTLQSEIPFGPFLIIGTAIVYFTGTTFVTLFL